jgi:hypothetical protein
LASLLHPHDINHSSTTKEGGGLGNKGGNSMKKSMTIIGLLVLVLVILLLIWYFFLGGRVEKRPPTLLRTASGIETTEFQLHDSLLFDATDLEPHAAYTIRVANEAGRVITQSRLCADPSGRIPETILWYDIGIRPCARMTADTVIPPVYARLAEDDITDFDYAGQGYRVQILRDERLVRESTFHVAEAMIRPVLYAADARGCPKAGFLIGEEDIWVKGKNFPKGSIIRLWAVPANMEWNDGHPLKDMTKQYYDGLPPLFELKGDQTGFRKRLWTKGLTSVGSYDIVAEVITYPFGSYHASASADVQNVVSHTSYSGFVIQRRQGEEEPLEMNLAGTRQSPLTYRDTFLSDETVYVGVDPAIQPGYIGQTAHVYIVDHKTEPQWVADKTLTDVTGTVEQITVQFVCGNCWATPAWYPPLTPGEYDVVLDFNTNGQYDSGIDLIDSLDPVGFYVSDVRVDSISFNYSGSSAITIYDNNNSTNVTAPEYVSGTNVIKPAAWVRGGAHQVQVTFRAVSTVTSANVWALGGLGGLAGSGSPVTIHFTGGSAQHNFSVNSVPNTVGKHEFYWDWKYIDITGTPSVTKSMGKTGQHLVYTTLANPVASLSPPWLVILDYACTWASGSTTNEAVCTNILNNGFANHYTWNGDCMMLASDFVRLVGTQGINGSQHKWASIPPTAIDDMDYQRTKVIDPVGPAWGNQAINWSWHQWAEAEGAQRDPSAAASVVGTWGTYEDYLFWKYEKVIGLSPFQTQWVDNQPGQSLGCEAPAHRSYTSTPPFYAWRGPDR